MATNELIVILDKEQMDELRREFTEIIERQAAEIESLKQTLEDKASGADEWQLKLDLQAAEIERLNTALDKIIHYPSKDDDLPLTEEDWFDAVVDMRRIARAAREVSNE